MIPAPVLLDVITKALAPYGDLIGEWEIGCEPIVQNPDAPAKFAYTITVTLIERADGPAPVDASVSTKGAPADDEHERARRVDDPPALLCWALTDGVRVCVHPIDEIDPVCPIHGRRRPPK